MTNDLGGFPVQEPIRDSRTLAVQLRARIAELIQEEGLKPGDKLPTEAQLTQRFRISRPALREALKLLEQDDVVYVEHGRGRFISALSAVKVDRPITVFESVSELAGHYGYRTVNKVLSISEELPNERVAECLQLGSTDRVIRIERIRLHDDKPILYSVDYVPQKVIPGHTADLDWCGSLVNMLDEYGHRPLVSAASVSAVMLPDDVISRYGLEFFGPALLIDETCFNAAGGPVNYAVNYHRGTHFTFRFTRK